MNYFAFPGLYNRYQRKLLLVPGPSLFARFVLDLPHALRLKVNVKASVTSAVMEAESRSAARVSLCFSFPWVVVGSWCLFKLSRESRNRPADMERVASP